MLCCSSDCEKYTQCAHSGINNPGSIEQIIDWARHGSCSIQYKDGRVVKEEHYDCGPTSNYAMYTPYIPLESIIFPEHYHQVTIDEWIKEKDKEKEKMDNIDVRVKVITYKNNRGAVDMDFDHPLYVHSVPYNDELVELGYEGCTFIVSESELVKAAKLCANNRW